MSDYRSVLERDLDRIGPAPFALPDVARRRERRRRQRRIAASVVALAISALAIGGWLGAVALDRTEITGDHPKPPQFDLPIAPTDWTPGPIPGHGHLLDHRRGIGARRHRIRRRQRSRTSHLDVIRWRDVGDRVQQEFTNEFSDVTTGGPGLVAVGGWSGGVGHPSGPEGAVWTSVDGLTWSQVPSDPVFDGASLQAVVAGGPGLVAVGQDHEGAQAWFSIDGREWSVGVGAAAAS